MTWFFLAIAPPLLYALTNHIDKGLLEKYFVEGGVGTLLLFSALLSVLPLPLLYWGDPSVVPDDPAQLIVLAFVGLSHVAVLWFYLLALKEDEASRVVVFYQLLPVFGLLLAYLILGETVSKMQMLAMAIILVGTTFVSFEIDGANRLKFKKKTVAFMLLAGLSWALGDVLFKAVALKENVWRSLFWEHVVLVTIGVVIYACIPMYRHHFKLAIRKNSKSIMFLNGMNESLYILGNILAAFAVMLVPVVLVHLAQTFQSAFVFVLGLLLVWFRFSSESVALKNIIPKIIAIAVTCYGTHVLLMHT